MDVLHMAEKAVCEGQRLDTVLVPYKKGEGWI